MDDIFDNWTIQVHKGVVELCLLSALAGGEHYGYALVLRLIPVCVQDESYSLPEGVGKLAGGASHRLVGNKVCVPEGRWKSKGSARFPLPLPGRMESRAVPDRATG